MRQGEEEEAGDHISEADLGVVHRGHPGLVGGHAQEHVFQPKEFEMLRNVNENLRNMSST